MPSKILIVGLRQVGTAVGLAMSRSEDPPTLFGYDLDKAIASAALEAGAFERRVLDPRKTAREAELIIVTLSEGEAPELITDLATELKPGAVMLDLTTQAHTPETMSALSEHGGKIIRGHAVVSADDLLEHDVSQGLRADAYQGGLLGLAVAPDTPEEGIELVLSVADAIGATPFFIDVAELDYVNAAVDSLPSIMGLILLRSLAAAPGWGNIQRLAGRPFADYITLATSDSEGIAERIWTHRTSLLAQLDGLAREIERVEASLHSETSDQLEELMAEAQVAHDEWIQVRLRGRPRSAGDTTLPTRGILGNLFGINPRRPPEDDQAG
jgi:prephenate dehydrogenase